MFEATTTERVHAGAEAVWDLWADPGRWPDWDARLEAVEPEGEIELGTELKLKLRKGGRVAYEVVALEPQRELVTEARFPGARLRHEQRLEPGRDSVEVTHVLRLEGPASGFWALMMGRKKLRQAVAGFSERERELLEPSARPKRSRNKRRR